MSQHKLVWAKLSAKTEALREEYLAKLKEVSEFSRANEDGVLVYAIGVPRDTSDTTTVYVVEQYADQNALETHNNQAIVQSLIKWMTENEVLTTPPKVHTLSPAHENSTFTRPSALQAQDPWFLVGQVNYNPGAAAAASLPYWKDVVETGRTDEPGTLSYGIWRDAETLPDAVFAVEVYESERYLMDVHVPSRAVQENIRGTGGTRTGIEHARIKLRAGFLCRG